MIKKTLKATGFEFTTAITDYLEKIIVSVDKLVPPSDESALVDIEVGKSSNHHKSGDIFRAEVNFHSALGHFRAEAESGDVYSAIDMVRDEIVEVVRSKKDRRMSLVRKGGALVKNILKGFRGK